MNRYADVTATLVDVEWVQPYWELEIQVYEFEGNISEHNGEPEKVINLEATTLDFPISREVKKSFEKFIQEKFELENVEVELENIDLD